jgi:erythromycin esterase
MKFPLRLALCTLLALPLAACDDPVDPEAQGPDLTWLRQNAVPLATTDPGGSYTDLAPLKEMVGSARIVGLGEQTHGTREFFRFKHRAVEYLVKEMGFNTFAIEAPWAEANRVNHYVHTGEGDPEVLLSHLQYWTWNTAEVLELIRWMRQHNQNPGAAPRVSFLAFDVQNARVAMRDVEAYLRGVNGASADSVAAHYACYLAWSDTIGGPSQNYAGASAQQKALCQQGVAAAYAQMSAGAGPYTAATSAKAYDLALRAARVAVQNEDLSRGAGASGPNLRDKYMAENVEWIAGPAGSGRKVVLWAHSGHINNRQPWMGWHLANQYADAYRIVGFSFHRGAFNAVRGGSSLGLLSINAPPAIEASYEHQFHRLGLPRFMVDLRPVRRGQAPGGEWLAGPLPMRHIGAVYDPASPELYYFPTALATEYDILVHVEEGTATQLLPFRFQ